MRKTLLVTFVFFVVAAWAVAQQGNTQTPGGSSQAPSTSSPNQEAAPQAPSTSNPSQEAAPQNPSTSNPSQPATPQSGPESTIEGCLGGTTGNYSLTDKTGTTYKVQLPEKTDPSILQKYVGQEVAIKGSVADASDTGSASADTGASKGAANSKTLKATAMAKIADTCSAKPGTPPAK